MTKKLEGKHVFLIVAFLCIIIFVLYYFFGYSDTKEKTDALYAENLGLTTKIASMEMYYRNESDYKKQTTEYQEKFAALVEQVPSDLRPEDALMTGIKVKNESGLTYKQITLGDREEMYTVSEDTILGAAMDDYQKAIVYNQYTVAYDNKLDYGSLKEAIQSIFACDYKANISSIAYARDPETGNLEGFFELHYYYVTGNNQEYVAPNVPSYTEGLTDIFATGYNLDERAMNEETVAEETEEVQTTETAE